MLLKVQFSKQAGQAKRTKKANQLIRVNWLNLLKIKLIN